MKQKDYYQILGIKETAEETEIKQAYRNLAKKWHPDRNPEDASAEGKFKEISEAYEVLGDKEKRRRYDELRKYGSGGAPGSMSWEDFSSRFGGVRTENAREFTWGFDGDNLNDIFADLFGGKRERRSRPQRTQQQRPFSQSRNQPSDDSPQSTSDPFFKRRGQDAYVDITLNIAQALLGSTIRVRTPGGKKVNVRIQPGTQPEAVLRLRGLGYETGAGSGDLFIQTHISIPDNLTEAQQEKVRELAEALSLKH
jgi:DnaJ-class molecular chaperone